MTDPDATWTVERVEQLRLATRTFIRETVIQLEPPPGAHLGEELRALVQAQAREAGVFAPQVPVEFGGLGLPIEHWSPIFQEAGYSPLGPVALNCMAPDEGNMHMLGQIASPEQKQRFLGPLGRGEMRSCFGMTEPHPGAGSDPEALRTTAERVDGGWRIVGEKRFSSGAVGAGVAVVMARTEHEGVSGATMFLVDMDAPGVRVGEQPHAIDRAIIGGHPHLHFEGVTVSDDRVLGAVGEGFRYAQVRLGPARLTHCMRWLGLARRAQDTALDRTAKRRVFGSPVDELGIAQGLIADSVIDIETSDAIIAKTARLLARDQRAGTALSSVAKVHCSEAVNRVIDRAVQLVGGDGVTEQLPLASYLNEVRPFRIYDGSNETQRWAISRRASRARAREVAAGEPERDTLRAAEQA
ncbi:acyl-CoA dehydrogenase family protein [Leucobacter weissii]|uniref:Acyl-CoA dehydrogenase family protein n=1 Tax=Leucobacter weissii TaxID=1983706 RepID=A0A939MN73_9MICO|nr:acyl-CoA dehydrogenase family protein [Leucobacter weissii]MBO1901551.1 acyl-CoA dehydrogenase family protein [Leucobacter weissii]